MTVSNEITTLQLGNLQIIDSVEPGKWIFKITKDGFKFNHQEYPNLTPDGFAQAFCDILEKQYTVTFEKRSDRE